MTDLAEEMRELCWAATSLREAICGARQTVAARHVSGMLWHVAYHAHALAQLFDRSRIISYGPGWPRGRHYPAEELAAARARMARAETILVELWRDPPDLPPRELAHRMWHAAIVWIWLVELREVDLRGYIDQANEYWRRVEARREQRRAGGGHG